MTSTDTRPTTLDAAQLRTWLEQPDGPRVLDVRTPGEFASGHLPGAVNVPVQELEQKWASLKVPADRPVVVYCRSGARSSRAKSMLEAFGVKKVVDVGPMPDWK